MIELWHYIRDGLLLKEWFTPLTLLIGGVWAIIGGAWALFSHISSKKQAQNSTELLNQPKFTFLDSMGEHAEVPSSCDISKNDQQKPTPDYCCNPHCDKLHWFDIKNVGNFSAEQVSVSMVLEGEDAFLEKMAQRVMERKHLQAGESFQYSLDDCCNVDDRHHSSGQVGEPYCFYVLLQYRSKYSKCWYRRVYQLEASKILTENTMGQGEQELQRSAWACGIEFYAVNEFDSNSQKDVNIFKKVAAFFNKKQTMTLQQYAEKWVINFLELSWISRKIVKLCRRITKNKW